MNINDMVNDTEQAPTPSPSKRLRDDEQLLDEGDAADYTFPMEGVVDANGVAMQNEPQPSAVSYDGPLVPVAMQGYEDTTEDANLPQTYAVQQPAYSPQRFTRSGKSGKQSGKVARTSSKKSSKKVKARMRPPHEAFTNDNDEPMCAFCLIPGTQRAVEGELLGPFEVANGKVIYAHRQCITWTPEVYTDPPVEGESVVWRDVDKAYKRARGKKCMYCKGLGASVSCMYNGAACCRPMHFRCALMHKATLAVDTGFITLCHLHGRKPPKKEKKEPVPFETMLVRTPVPLPLLAKNSIVSCCDRDNFDMDRGNVLHCGKCFDRIHAKCLAEDFAWGGVFMNLAYEGKFRCKKCMECVVCGENVVELGDDVTQTCRHCRHMKVCNSCVDGDLENGWRCDTCRSCYHCGYNVESHNEWSEEHRACLACAQAIIDKNAICPSCNRVWREGIPEQTMIQCDACDDWVHGDESCSGLTPAEYEILDSSSKKYYCPTCTFKKKEKKRRDRLAKAIESREAKSRPKKRSSRSRTGKEDEGVEFVPIYASSDEEDGASFRLFDKYNPRSRKRNEPAPFTKIAFTDASSFVADAGPHTELCVTCCTSGAGVSLRHCSACGDSYHGFCLDGKLPELTDKPLVSSHSGTAYRLTGGGTGPNAKQWLCPSCTTCQKCAQDDATKDIILCDHCDRGVHLSCLSPPLETAPEGAFFCEECRFCELCGKPEQTPTRVKEHLFCSYCAPVVQDAVPCRVCENQYPEASGKIIEKAAGQVHTRGFQTLERTGAKCSVCHALTHADCDEALEASESYRCPPCRGVAPEISGSVPAVVCGKKTAEAISDVSESQDEIEGNTIRASKADSDPSSTENEVEGSKLPNGVEDEEILDITNDDASTYFDEDRIEWVVDCVDRRRCEMCQLGDNANPKMLGRLVPLPPDAVNSHHGFLWVHAACMLWCPGTTLMNDDGRYGVLGPRKVVLQYAKSNVCTKCGKRGASVNCHIKNCLNVYHFACATEANVMCHTDEQVEEEGNATGMPTYCRTHAKRSAKTLKEANADWDFRHQFRILRLKEIPSSDTSTTIEPKPLRNANAKAKTLVRVGGLTVISLGRLVPDTGNYILQDRLVPTGYRATRHFWSMKTLGKRVLYYFEVRGDVSWGPEFCVWNEEDPDNVIKGIDVNEVWGTVKKRVQLVILRSNKALTTLLPTTRNGFEAFGLALRPVVSLIESLPMAWIFTHRYKFRYRRPVPKNAELAKRLLGTRGLHPGKEPPVNKTGSARTEGYIPQREKYRDVYAECPSYVNNDSGTQFQIGVAMESEGFEHFSPNTGTALGIGEWCRKSVVRADDDRTKRSVNNVTNKENLSTARLYRLMQDQHAMSRERKYQVLRSAIAGYGVFAKTTIKKGEYIIEYSGDEVRPIISDLRENKYINNREQLYLFSFNGEAWELQNRGKGKGKKSRELRELLVVDATKSGNAARFINHSCNPNCIALEIINDIGREAIVIIGLRNVTRGEELTYDYMLSPDGGKEEPPCHCGASNCRGTMIIRREGVDVEIKKETTSTQ